MAFKNATVIICPGGAYEWLSPREAEPVAKAFEDAGYKTAICRYTVGSNLGRKPLMELSDRVKAIKEKEQNGKIILCGFSAGGHLAASYGVHYKDCCDIRPDAMILGYPVITSGEHAHQRTIDNLGLEYKEYFSLEKHVSESTPPSFIWHTATDPEVPVENSLLLAQALSAAKVPYELHIYDHGVHGLSLCTPEVDEPEKDRLSDKHIAGWFDLCIEWLDGIMEKKKGD